MEVVITLGVEETEKAENSKASTMTPALDRMCEKMETQISSKIKKQISRKVYEQTRKEVKEEDFISMVEANLPAEKIAQVFKMSVEEVQEKIAQLQNLDQIEAGF